MESIYNMAKTYYPDLWDKARIDMLVSAGKLSADEYEKIVGEVPETTEPTDNE